MGSDRALPKEVNGWGLRGSAPGSVPGWESPFRTFQTLGRTCLGAAPPDWQYNRVTPGCPSSRLDLDSDWEPAVNGINQWEEAEWRWSWR